MSPRPAYEPDENEPDENEPDEDEGGHHTATTASTPSNSSGGGSKHQTITGSPTGTHTGSADNNALPESSSNNNSVPASTIGPVIVVLVVVIVLATCCILHCARVRKRMNDQTNTQSINGWTSFLQFKSQKSSHNNADEAIATPSNVEQGIVSSSMTTPTAGAAAMATRGMAEKDNNNNNEGRGGGTWRKPVKKRDYYDRAFHYRMSKPPPLPPCDMAPTVAEEYNNQQGVQSTNNRKSKERQPSIVFSPGWLFAWSDKENEMESKNSRKHLIDREGTEMSNASTPLSPPESSHSITTMTNSTTITTPLKKKTSDPDRLCPHQITVEESPPSSIPPPVPSLLPASSSSSSSQLLQKPHEKSTI